MVAATARLASLDDLAAKYGDAIFADPAGR